MEQQKRPLNVDPGNGGRPFGSNIAILPQTLVTVSVAHCHVIGASLSPVSWGSKINADERGDSGWGGGGQTIFVVGKICRPRQGHIRKKSFFRSKRLVEIDLNATTVPI